MAGEKVCLVLKAPRDCFDCPIRADFVDRKSGYNDHWCPITHRDAEKGKIHPHCPLFKLSEEAEKVIFTEC